MKNRSICILVTLVAICVIYIRMSEEVIKYNNYFKIDNAVKYVDSDIIEEVSDEILFVEEQTEVVEEIKITDQISKDIVETVVPEIAPVTEEKREETVDVPVIVEPQNEIITGKMSGYGPDCVGCSGYVAYGKYVGKGNIYYDDPEYGQVRIVAGDRKYDFGTIVRINDSMLAIVLDRGGAIGIGKRCLFDLLYVSEEEANKHGVFYDVKFEILRNGF